MMTEKFPYFIPERIIQQLARETLYIEGSCALVQSWNILWMLETQTAGNTENETDTESEFIDQEVGGKIRLKAAVWGRAYRQKASCFAKDLGVRRVKCYAGTPYWPRGNICKGDGMLHIALLPGKMIIDCTLDSTTLPTRNWYWPHEVYWEYTDCNLWSGTLKKRDNGIPQNQLIASSPSSFESVTGSLQTFT